MLDPVGAFDAPCLVAGLVATRLRSTAMSGFCVALVAKLGLFSVSGWPLTTNEAPHGGRLFPCNLDL